MRVIITGIWICAATVLSCYGMVTYGAGLFAPKTEPYLEGLQYQKLRAINVPIIADGAVQGYIVTTLVFTADAKLMHALPVPPNSFVIDEAFRQIYTDTDLDFRRLKKYNVTKRLAEIRQKVNERLGADVVKDVLVEDFNFVSKRDAKS
ncbi:hypothetical protein [Methylobacterium isbiliense]|jgi:hypothetical protein|uniref:Flagellar protein FliL n=1 Tax=Methylobacterium isbiliense TaxID=315478 RepID=A0ABQ4SHZ2_9HYPH|nr:hypothetical protein [Methylobacterium isbiliense]MDN3624357.1 hypothetical protein [Methylobacterium isbiliense]GJE01368.1 hypothetical protein GMJLKIPL_3298 [Methylobacterium isbiliense]